METLLDFMVEAQVKKQMTSSSPGGRCIQVLPWKRFVFNWEQNNVFYVANDFRLY